MYNVGDRVKINPESQYVYQAGGRSGTIKEYYGDVRYCYSVQWDCGIRGDYKVSDLLTTVTKAHSGSKLRFNFIKRNV